MVLASQVVQVDKNRSKRVHASPLLDEDSGGDAAGNVADVLYVEDVDRRRDIGTKQNSSKEPRRIDESLSKLSRRDDDRSNRRQKISDEGGKPSASIPADKHDRKTTRKKHAVDRFSPLSDDDGEPQKGESSSRRQEKRRDEAPLARSSKDDSRRSTHQKSSGGVKNEKASPHHRSSGKNSAAAAEDGAADVLSVEATNKLRAKLGLPLLPTGGNGAQTAEPTAAAPSAYEQRKEVHAPPTNFNEKRERDNLREKIRTMRERHELERRLLVDKRTGKFESIGTSISSVKKPNDSPSSKRAPSKATSADADDDDIDDVRNWVKKSRSLGAEKHKAAERERLMQEMDAELGISDLVNAEITKSTEQYVNVGDLRVEHDLNAVNTDQPLLLTLKDAPVLKEKRPGVTSTAADDDDEDVLINVDMVDAEKTASNVATRRKMPKNYNPFEEASERWYGSGQSDSAGLSGKNVLSKYDEEIEGEKKKWFRLGAAATSATDAPAGRTDTAQTGKAVDEDDKTVNLLPSAVPEGGARFGGGRFAVAADYLGEEEARKNANNEVKFKKGGKKRMPTSSRNSGSKASTKAASRIGELLLDDDGDFDDKKAEANRKVAVDADDDDDYLDVQRMLQRHRTRNFVRPNLKDDESLLQPKAEPESMQFDSVMPNFDDVDDELKPKIAGGGIVLDETSEFCRNIGDFKGDDEDDADHNTDFASVPDDMRAKSTKKANLAEVSDEEEKMLIDDDEAARRPKRTLDDFAQQYNTLGNMSSSNKAVAVAGSSSAAAAGGGGSWQEATFETEQPELERHFRGRRQYRQPQQETQPSRSQRPPTVRAGSEEGQIEDDDDASSNFTGGDRNDDDDEDGHAVLDAEPKIGKGLASALNLVVRKNLIDSKSGRTGNRVVVSSQRRTAIEAKSFVTEDKRFDTIDDKRRGGGGGGHHGFMRNHHGPVENFRDDKKYVKFKLDLVSRDTDGRELSQREAFQQMSHIFHGKRPGKSKNEKRQKKSAETLIMQKMSATDTPLGTVDKMMNKQKLTGMPYIVLSGGGGESKVGIADLVKDKASK